MGLLGEKQAIPGAPHSLSAAVLLAPFLGLAASPPRRLAASPAGAGAIRRLSGYRAMPTYLVSRYSSMPSAPPSRPTPEALTPPNGAAGLDTMPWLTPTIP